jgi:hypothetical protein
MSDNNSKNVLTLVLETVGSLRITVTLFALSLILVFFGTLAQVDSGLWTVIAGYFRSWFVWIPFQLVIQFGQKFFGLPASWRVPGALPFPGGWTIGWLLLCNLLAAYSLRVPGYMKHWQNYAIMGAIIALDCLIGYVAVLSLNQWQFLGALAVIALVNVAALYPFRKAIFFPGNRIGILTLHVGLVLMMVGEFITGLYAVEGHMRIEEGETTSVVIHNRTPELAFVDTSDKKTDTHTVVPGRLLKKGATISHDDLPVDVEILDYMVNSRLRRLRPDDDNPATKGRGLEVKAVEVAEVSGVDTKQTAELPSIYAQLTDKTTGADLGTYLFSLWADEQKIKVGGKTYDVSLRFKQSYKPYTLELLEFRFDRYAGTNTPKNFSSKVILRDDERGDDREVLIKMNSPLRHRGDTFFQADWNKDTEKGTVLQVVRNPAWQLPYWSCAIVAIGMLIHFGLNLVNFLGRRAGE